MGLAANAIGRRGTRSLGAVGMIMVMILIVVVIVVIVSSSGLGDAHGGAEFRDVAFAVAGTESEPTQFHAQGTCSQVIAMGLTAIALSRSGERRSSILGETKRQEAQADEGDDGSGLHIDGSGVCVCVEDGEFEVQRMGGDKKKKTF